MSFLLECGTKPYGLKIKTIGFPVVETTKIFLGKYEISLEDFLYAVEYVLTNTNLSPEDPRLLFIKNVQSMEIVDGFGSSGTKRLKAPEGMDLPKKMPVEIVKIPSGSAPEWVREKWVGVRFVVSPMPSDADETDLFSGKPLEKRSGVRVGVREALGELANKSLEAAKWLSENILSDTDFLVFGSDEIKVLEWQEYNA